MPTIDNTMTAFAAELEEYVSFGNEIKLSTGGLSLRGMHSGQILSSGEVITARSHVTTDGRFLFLVSQTRVHPYTSDRIVVNKFDPCNQMQHISQIVLCHNTSDGKL